MSRHRNFYVAVASVKDGPEHVFIVMPDGTLNEDSRTVVEIECSASEKGYEISYCALYSYSIGRWTAEKLRQALFERMKAKYADVRSEWDVEMDVKVKVLDPGEELREQNRRNWYGKAQG